jgi:hypothetical protein
VVGTKAKREVGREARTAARREVGREAGKEAEQIPTKR